MSDHESRIKDPMSVEAIARGWVVQLENTHAKKIGQPLPIARKHLARKVGVSPGTLENIRRGRLKELRRGAEQKLRAFMVAHLQAEIQRHQHELEIILRGCEDTRGNEIIEAQTYLQKARLSLNALVKIAP